MRESHPFTLRAAAHERTATEQTTQGQNPNAPILVVTSIVSRSLAPMSHVQTGNPTKIKVSKNLHRYGPPRGSVLTVSRHRFLHFAWQQKLTEEAPMISHWPFRDVWLTRCDWNNTNHIHFNLIEKVDLNLSLRFEKPN